MLFLAAIITVGYVAVASGAPTTAEAKGWNSFLDAENIFPVHLDNSVSLSAPFDAKDGVVERTEAVMNELEDLLSNPQTLSQLYDTFLVNVAAAHAVRKSEGRTFRQGIFKTRLLGIAQHNLEYQQGQHGWFKGVTQFSDWTKEEFDSVYTPNPAYKDSPDNKTLPAAPVLNVKLPASLDYRAQGVLSRVKDQNPCGSCYAFSAIGALESVYAIKNGGKILELSEEEIRDCSAAQGNNGCSGGRSVKAIKYIMARGGVSLESEYPYVFDSAEHPCKREGTSKNAGIAKYIDLWPDYKPTTEDNLLSHLVQYGPLPIALNADGWDWEYKGGAFTTCGPPNKTTHAVLLVGYDADNFIIKNSWSPKWGDNGFIYIPRGGNNCGVLNEPYAISELL